MKNVPVAYGQNILDIALQEYGDAEGLFDLCQDNNLSLSEVLTVGQILVIDEAKIRNLRVVQEYQRLGFTVVTGNETEAKVTGDFGLEFTEDFGADYS